MILFFYLELDVEDILLVFDELFREFLAEFCVIILFLGFTFVLGDLKHLGDLDAGSNNLVDELLTA